MADPSERIREFINKLPANQRWRVDASVVWVYSSKVPWPGEFNCRIAIMRSTPFGLETPGASVEAQAATIDLAVATAIKKITRKILIR